jgi:hypothetical protein
MRGVAALLFSEKTLFLCLGGEEEGRGLQTHENVDF